MGEDLREDYKRLINLAKTKSVWNIETFSLGFCGLWLLERLVLPSGSSTKILLSTQVKSLHYPVPPPKMSRYGK
jgi:hypothetical protein